MRISKLFYHMWDDQSSLSSHATIWAGHPLEFRMMPARSLGARAHTAMAYDDESDRIIMSKGDTWTLGNPDAPKDNSPWAYDFNTNTWEERKSVPAPAPACVALGASRNTWVWYTVW
jgi:hypothetical protein